MKTTIILSAVSLFVTANTAGAVFIYKTGFENPPFVAGTPLLGVDEWDINAPSFLNLQAATISDSGARSGQQAVMVRGMDMEAMLIEDPDNPGTLINPVAPYYMAVGSSRRPFTYIVTDALPIIKLEADIMIEGPLRLTARDFFCATITPRLDGTSPGGNTGVTLGEGGICSNGTATGVRFGTNASHAPASFTRRGYPLNQWHHVVEFVNFANYTITYTVDGSLIHVTNIPRNNVEEWKLIRAAMVVYVRPSGGNKDDYTARFDNFKVSAQANYD